MNAISSEFLPITDELVIHVENIREKYYRAIHNYSERRFVVNKLASLLNEYWKDLIKPRMPLDIWRTPMNLLQDIVGDEFKGEPGIRQGLKWLEGSKNTKEFIEYSLNRFKKYY